MKCLSLKNVKCSRKKSFVKQILITLHAHAQVGGYVIVSGVHLYACLYVPMYVTKKSLNGTLAVDSPFQTLAVDFSSNL